MLTKEYTPPKMINRANALQPDEVPLALSLAQASGLYTPAQIALIEERCLGVVINRPVDDYEVIIAHAEGTLSGFIIFRKRTLTESAFEISHLGATGDLQLARLLEHLREEALSRAGTLIFAELPDNSAWQPVSAVLKNTGYVIAGQTPHLYAPGSGTRHYVLYFNASDDPQVPRHGYTPSLTSTPRSRAAWPPAVIPTTLDHRRAILDMTAATSVFTVDDRSIVEELIDLYLRDGSGSGYSFLSYRHDNTVIAFCCFGLRPSTTGTYDLYWICTDSHYRKKGAGQSLMAAVEIQVIQQAGYLVILETSDTPPFAPTREFYEAIGYTRLVYIKKFYSDQDGLVVYAKYLKHAV